jgi:hypothetical protein
MESFDDFARRYGENFHPQQYLYAFEVRRSTEPLLSQENAKKWRRSGE